MQALLDDGYCFTGTNPYCSASIGDGSGCFYQITSINEAFLMRLCFHDGMLRDRINGISYCTS